VVLEPDSVPLPEERLPPGEVLVDLRRDINVVSSRCQREGDVESVKEGVVCWHHFGGKQHEAHCHFQASVCY